MAQGLSACKAKYACACFRATQTTCSTKASGHRRLRYAWEYRKAVMGPDVSNCRIIFGEADQFPGLTVDRYGTLLSAQVLSVGMERLKHTLFPALVQMLRADGQDIRGLYERNDVALREKEGLAQYKGWYDLSAWACRCPRRRWLHICENGIHYTVDVENGQKTGFFLDQKYNRRAVAALARGRTVLDCFTHTGSFALNAAKGGAVKVTAVDVSEAACAMARRNAEENGLSGVMQCVAADVFELLPTLSKGSYDFIILDPPAFTKARKTLRNALRGYKEINTRAMRLLPRGGYLATCSCSHFATQEEFCKMLAAAAADAGVQLRQIAARQPGAGSPHFVERARDRLPEVLPVSGGVNAGPVHRGRKSCQKRLQFPKLCAIV